MGAEVAFVVGSHRAQTGPVVLRMHQNWVVLGSVIVQHCFQNLIFHLDELESLIHALFVLTGHNGHHIAHKAHMAVNEQAVMRTGFRIGLASRGASCGTSSHVKIASMPGTFFATAVLIVLTMAFACGERSSFTIRQSCGITSSI